MYPLGLRVSRKYMGENTESKNDWREKWKVGLWLGVCGNPVLDKLKSNIVQVYFTCISLLDYRLEKLYVQNLRSQ